MGVFKEHAELDFAVAQDVRVGRSAGAVLVQEVLKNPLSILLCKINVVQGYLKLLAKAPRILQIISGRAITVVILPVGHVQRMYVRTLLLQEQRGHCGINTAGETQNDAPPVKIVMR